jgi:hypothetical protein
MAAYGENLIAPTSPRDRNRPAPIAGWARAGGATGFRQRAHRRAKSDDRIRVPAGTQPAIALATCDRPDPASRRSDHAFEFAQLRAPAQTRMRRARNAGRRSLSRGPNRALGECVGMARRSSRGRRDGASAALRCRVRERRSTLLVVLAA